MQVLPATPRLWRFLVPALQAEGRDPLLPLVAAELSRVMVAGHVSFSECPYGFSEVGVPVP